jgi:hypothetical protein
MADESRLKDKVYIMDHDSQKIVIIEKDELENISKDESRIPDAASFDPGLDTTAALPANAKGQALMALQDSEGTPFLFALYLVPDPAGALANNIVPRLSVGSDGGLACDARVVARHNAQELCPVHINNRDIAIYIPATGGKLNQ